MGAGLAAVFLHHATELGGIYDQIETVFACIVCARGALADATLSQIADFVSQGGLVIAEAPLDRRVTIEVRRTTLGDVIAQQPEEIVRESRVVALDRVDRKHEQITGNRNRSFLLERTLARQSRAASCRDRAIWRDREGAANALAAYRQHRMLRRDMEAVTRAPWGDRPCRRDSRGA